MVMQPRTDGALYAPGMPSTSHFGFFRLTWEGRQRCPRDDTPGRLMHLFLPTPPHPPSTSHLGCVTGDLGLQRASHAPWGLALPLFSFPCLPGGFFSFSSPTEGRGGNADGEAWCQRDLAVLCPGSPAAHYRALGGLEKGHHLQVNADRAFAGIKCCLVRWTCPI